MKLRTTPARLTLAIVGLAATAHAQADFHEPFEHSGPNFQNPGPPDLIAKGWTFRNQSEPAVGNAWFNGPILDGFVWTFDPQAGEHYLAANASATSSFTGGPISTWAILPEVPGLATGDVVSLWARENAAPQNDARVEIRYSPTGGLSTGSSATDVGDFTTLLEAIDPLPSQSWGAYDATVPGSGRLALRFHVPFECGFETGNCNQHSFVAVDELHVGAPILPPCNSPADPIAGQTVVWTQAGSPYELCGEVTVPEGATVVIEPGVHLEFGDHGMIVEGRLTGTGTTGAPITMHSDKLLPFALTVVGEVELSGAVLDLRIAMSELGSVLVLRDSTLDTRDVGHIGQIDDALSVYDKVAPILRLENVEILDDGQGSSVYLPQAQVALENVRSDRGLIWAGGYVFADGIEVYDSASDGIRLSSGDGVYVDDVIIRDAVGAGLVLVGYASGTGPSVVIEGCDYPMAVGGLHTDSNLPSTGNDNNAIFALGGGYWPDLGLPYHATVDMGGMVIEPGVQVLSSPGVQLAPGRLRGAPGQPITLGALDPSQPWTGLLITAKTIDQVVVEDATLGILTQQAVLWVLNSVVRNCEIGMVAAQYGSLIGRGVRVEQNQIGVKTTNFGNANFSSPDLPNQISGNVAGMQADDQSFDKMEWIWWGDPSGPKQPDNPGGMGDEVVGSGAADVDVLPFLTAPPAIAGSPPTVLLVGHQGKAQIPGLTLDPGDTAFIEWSSTDDGQIVEHRLYYSPAGQHPSSFVLLDVLPGDRTIYEYVAPDVGQYNLSPYLRIDAIDDSGLVGSDTVALTILNNAQEPTEGVVTPDYAGQTLPPGLRLPSPGWTYTTPGVIEGSPHLFVALESTETYVDLGQAILWCDLPFSSTDRARFVIKKQNTTNTQKWMFGDYFSIRPDALIGDAPPVVALLSPAPGQDFVGGSVVPISWTASDDEAIRAYNLQVSTDGGKRWRTFARDLPATQTNYDWTLPASQGLDDVRLRVVAFDLRNQNSAADLVPGIDVLPGTGVTCQADLGFGGPGALSLSLCGDPLNGTGSATLSLTGALAGAPLLTAVSFQFLPTPALGGTIVVGPDALLIPLQADSAGEAHWPVGGIGGIPATIYAQAVALDGSLPGGFAISNALQVQLVP